MTINRPDKRSNTLLKFLLSAIILILFIAGLWPFNFFPRNKVSWMKNKNGIRFFGTGIVYSQNSLPISRSSIEKNPSFLLELTVTPDNEPQNGISRILSFCDDKKEEIFYIGQWRSHLILKTRSRDQKTGEPVREFGADNVLPAGKVRSITVVSGNEGTSIFVDRILVDSSRRYFLLPTGTTEGILILGNSPSGKNPWRGELTYLAVHHGPIATYTFDEGLGRVIRDKSGLDHMLVIPERFAPLNNDILTPPWKETRFGKSFLKDVAINILGFVPFGICCLAWIRAKQGVTLTGPFPSIVVLISGVGISLIIELLQVFLPTRNSSLTDVISNMLGTGIGVWFYRYLHQQFLES